MAGGGDPRKSGKHSRQRRKDKKYYKYLKMFNSSLKTLIKSSPYQGGGDRKRSGGRKEKNGGKKIWKSQTSQQFKSALKQRQSSSPHHHQTASVASSKTRQKKVSKINISPKIKINASASQNLHTKIIQGTSNTRPSKFTRIIKHYTKKRMNKSLSPRRSSTTDST